MGCLDPLCPAIRVHPLALAVQLIPIVQQDPTHRGKVKSLKGGLDLGSNIGPTRDFRGHIELRCERPQALFGVSVSPRSIDRTHASLMGDFDDPAQFLI